MSLAGTVARNSVFSTVGLFTVKALSFVFAVYVVRKLGDASFGQYSFILAYVALFAIFSDLGLAPHVVREVARDRSKAVYLYSNAVAIRLLLSGLVVAVATAGAFWLKYSPELVLGVFLASCGLFLYALQGMLDSVVMGQEKLNYSAFMGVSNQLIFVLLGTLALVMGWGFIGLILASLTGVAVSGLVGAALALRRFRWAGLGLDIGGWPALMKAALPRAGIGFALAISYKVDTVLLSFFRGDAEVGWYSAAYNLIFALMTISHGINLALYPSLSRQQVLNPGAVSLAGQTAFRYLLAVSLPLAVGGVLLSDKIVRFLYTDAFSSSATALSILILVVPLMFTTELLGYLSIVTNRDWASARVFMVGAGANLGLNLLLLPRYGLLGASVVTVLTEAIILVQFLVLLRWTIPLSRLVAPVVRTGIACGVMATFVLAVGDIGLPAIVASGAAVYLMAGLAFGVLRLDELRLARALIGGGPASKLAGQKDLL